VEVCLKKTYLAYAKRAKFGNASSVSVQPTLTFMGNCLVELYSLDYHSSYQHAFVYIRQLALLLRGAMQKKTSEAMQQVYCWQYVHCLKLWVAVLSACAAAEDSDASLMKSLVYPLVEIIMGCARLIPAPVRHLPLTFHYVRLLQQLAASSETFIPTTSLLLDCLDWKEWTMHPKKATKRNSGPWQLSILLKFPKEDPLRTHEQLDASISEFFVLLHREIELYRYSAGFPEFSLRITSRLRRFAKDVSNQRWHSLAKACVAVCEQHSQAVVQARAQLQEAPKDVKRLECCKPASVPPMRVRHEEAITKERKSFERHQQQAKSNKDESEDEDSSNEEMEERTKRKKNKAKEQRSQAAASNEMKRAKLLNDDELMEAQDEVQEGIDWSDDDED
jgi:nucleolar complex protein 2